MASNNPAPEDVVVPPEREPERTTTWDDPRNVLDKFYFRALLQDDGVELEPHKTRHPNKTFAPKVVGSDPSQPRRFCRHLYQLSIDYERKWGKDGANWQNITSNASERRKQIASVIYDNREKKIPRGELSGAVPDCHAHLYFVSTSCGAETVWAVGAPRG
jgi:hypothetical protein